MDDEEQIEISCIGVSYLQPIFDLYKKLSNIKFSGNSKIRVSSIENGYSVSIVVLIVLCIESLLNNIKYHNDASDRISLNFFKRKYRSYNDLIGNLEDLFILRNIIAHNYIWKIKYNFDNEYNEINIRKSLQEEYGDNNFNNKIDFKNKVTNKLRLRIIPTRIGLKETKQALLILKEFSDFLDDKKYNYLSNSPFRYGNKMTTLGEFMEKIKND